MTLPFAARISMAVVAWLIASLLLVVQRQRLGEVRVSEGPRVGEVRRVGELDRPATCRFGVVELPRVGKDRALHRVDEDEVDDVVCSSRRSCPVEPPRHVVEALPVDQNVSKHSGERRVVGAIANSLEQIEPVTESQLGSLQISPLERELGLGYRHSARSYEQARLDEQLASPLTSS